MLLQVVRAVVVILAYTVVAICPCPPRRILLNFFDTLVVMALPTGDPDLVALATSCKAPEEYISCLDGLNTELFACYYK